MATTSVDESTLSEPQVNPSPDAPSSQIDTPQADPSPTETSAEPSVPPVELSSASSGPPPPPPPASSKPKLRTLDPEEYGQPSSDPTLVEGSLVDGEGEGTFEGEGEGEGEGTWEEGEGEGNWEGEEEGEEEEEEEEDDEEELNSRMYTERRYIGGGSIDGEKSIWTQCYAAGATSQFTNFEEEQAQLIESNPIHIDLAGSLVEQDFVIPPGSAPFCKTQFFHLLSSKSKSGEELATLRVSSSLLDPFFSVASFEQEAQLWKPLVHPHIAKASHFYPSIGSDPQISCVAIEPIAGFDLFNQIIKSSAPITESTIRSIILQIVDALAYLHTSGIVYRNVSNEAIFFSNPASFDQLKLIDFRYALAGETSFSEWAVHPSFQPPELISRQPCSFPVDIWAVGILTHLLLFGHPPFQDSNQLRLRMKIKKGEFLLDPALSSSFSSPAIDFLKSALQPDPSKRPPITQLRAHPWLSSSQSSQESPIPALQQNLAKFL